MMHGWLRQWRSAGQFAVDELHDCVDPALDTTRSMVQLTPCSNCPLAAVVTKAPLQVILSYFGALWEMPRSHHNWRLRFHRETCVGTLISAEDRLHPEV
jgi:hypothetical protein